MLPGWPELIKGWQEVTHYTTIDGRPLTRIRYGDEDHDWGADRNSCYDCGVVKGQYHVGPDCAVEQCPACGDQIVECDCDFAGHTTEDEDAE